MSVVFTNNKKETDMKRLFFMLLIACSATTTISADPTASPVKKPESVIFTLNSIISKYGSNRGQEHSVDRNPNTGITESSIKIVPFSCSASDKQNDNVLKAVASNFQKDEPLSYQFLHIQPGNKETYTLKVITNNGKNNRIVRVRTNSNQEMWLMCTKNPDNPQLRDSYVVSWELSEDKKQVGGTVYMITSLRPDIYEKTQESLKKTFKIEGRVDANIKDSLYNIYIANSAEELAAIGDDDYVACVPVINKRFEWQTELDHPVVGRLRCIFPDGELCSAWINLDFVPGETYHITVHNGYFDSDNDYERRVGRYSGKSLLNKSQIRGNDDVKVLDSVVINDAEQNNWQPAKIFSLKDRVKEKVMPSLNAIEAKIKMIGNNYDYLDDYLESHIENNSLIGCDPIFKNIRKLNKDLDKEFQKVIKVVKNYEVPESEKMEKIKFMTEMYTGFVQLYTSQKEDELELYQEIGTKAAQRTLNEIDKIAMKYLNEMNSFINREK